MAATRENPLLIAQNIRSQFSQRTRQILSQDKIFFVINPIMKPAGTNSKSIHTFQINHRTGQRAKRRSLLIVQKAIARMRTEKEGSLDVQALARELGINYRTFRHTFHKCTGSSPYHYLLDLRLMHARDLLARTSQAVKEVARQTGFTDENHFSHHFKKKIGMAPSKWRYHSQHKLAA